MTFLNFAKAELESMEIHQRAPLEVYLTAAVTEVIEINKKDNI